jgi:hypothetical protein
MKNFSDGRFTYLKEEGDIKGTYRLSALDKNIIWLGLSSVFLSGLYIETNLGNLYFSYLLMLVVYVSALMRRGCLGLRKEYLTFFSILLSVSYLGWFLSGFNYGITAKGFILIAVRFLMLVFCILFFTSIYNLCWRSSKLLFDQYLKVASFFSIVGLLQELMFLGLGIDILGFVNDGSKDYGYYLGIAGLSVEPAFYACALMPAGAYHISRFTKNFQLSRSGAVTVGAILLSTSSLGYIGLFSAIFATIIFNLRSRYLLILIFTLPMLGYGIFKISQLPFFQMRLNDTVSVLTGAELTMDSGINLSTYSLAVNMSISLRSVQENYGLGAGFGAYSTVFDHYINDYKLPGYRDDLPGRGSATSLFARTTAELGVAAWFFILLMCKWSIFGIRRKEFSAISIAYASTFAIILLRMGEYYVNGLVLVLLMIHWIHIEVRRKRSVITSDKVKIDTSGNFRDQP